MKRTLTAALLVMSIFLVTSVPSCDSKNDPTGPAIFLGAVILLGLTVGGWFDDDYDLNEFPPDKYDVLSFYGDNYWEQSILSDWDKDWYRTEVLRPGEGIEIWSDSPMGVRGVLVDENGRYYPSDNPPGTDFHLEIEAPTTMSYYLMVEGHYRDDQGPYTLYWHYHFR